jgi:hypothetical protein
VPGPTAKAAVGRIGQRILFDTGEQLGPLLGSERVVEVSPASSSTAAPISTAACCSNQDWLFTIVLPQAFAISSLPAATSRAGGARGQEASQLLVCTRVRREE